MPDIAVTADRRKSLIVHMNEKVEDSYWEADGLQMVLVAYQLEI